MTQLEKLSSVLADGNWHSTEELVREVGHRFSATMHRAVKKYGYQIEKRRQENSRFDDNEARRGGTTSCQYEYRLILAGTRRLQTV